MQIILCNVKEWYNFSQTEVSGFPERDLIPKEQVKFSQINRLMVKTLSYLIDYVEFAIVLNCRSAFWLDIVLTDIF